MKNNVLMYDKQQFFKKYYDELSFYSKYIYV